MRTLAEDRDEVRTEKERAWVARKRREYGIGPDDAAVWTVDVEQSWFDPDTHDLWSVDIQVSPGDALWIAEARAWNAARQNGIGRWTLEVFGDGVNGPRMLVVRPHLDEAVS